MDEAQARRIGYKVFKNGDSFGIELFTPKRTSAMTYDLVLGADSKKQHTVSIWADKTKAPGKKLEIVTIISPSKMGDMDGFMASLIVKHPLLPRDLEYNMEHHFEQGLTYHTKFDFDVFDAQHKRWILENTIQNLALENGRNLTMATELLSQGTGASIVFDVHGALTTGFFSTGANLKLKEQELIEKELLFFVQASPQWFSFRIGCPEKQLAWEARWNSDFVGQFPRIQFTTSSKLFGLTPSVFAIDMNMSPLMDVKIFSETTPNVYYHMIVGKTEEQKFEFDLMRHDGAEKKELLGFSAKLDSSNIFSSRIHWKVEGLTELRAAIRSHFEAVITEFLNANDCLIKDMNLISSKWVAFKNMKVGIQQLLAAISKESKAFLKDSEEDESMREVMVIVKMFDRMIGQALDALHAVDFEIPSYEELAEEFIRAVTEFKEVSQEWLHHIIHTADSYAEELEEYIFENEVLIRAITGKIDPSLFNQERHLLSLKFTESYSTISERVTVAWTKIQAIINERIQHVSEWYEALSIAEKSVLTTITETLEVGNLTSSINFTVLITDS